MNKFEVRYAFWAYVLMVAFSLLAVGVSVFLDNDSNPLQVSSAVESDAFMVVTLSEDPEQITVHGGERGVRLVHIQVANLSNRALEIMQIRVLIRALYGAEDDFAQDQFENIRLTEVSGEVLMNARGEHLDGSILLAPGEVRTLVLVADISSSGSGAYSVLVMDWNDYMVPDGCFVAYHDTGELVPLILTRNNVMLESMVQIDPSI